MVLGQDESEHVDLDPTMLIPSHILSPEKYSRCKIPYGNPIHMNREPKTPIDWIQWWFEVGLFSMALSTLGIAVYVFFIC